MSEKADEKNLKQEATVETPVEETETKGTSAEQAGEEKPAEGGANEEKSLEELLEEEKKKAHEANEKLLRAKADFDNFRKRLAKEREDAVRFANEGLLQDLLPVWDNFELGLMSAEQAADAKAILVGFQMVRSQFQRFLEDSGVQEIEAEGKAFDPNVHEAVGQEESEDKEEGTILYQRRKGYRLKDRLLRPANVIVATSKQTAEAEVSEEAEASEAKEED